MSSTLRLPRWLALGLGYVILCHTPAAYADPDVVDSPLMVVRPTPPLALEAQLGGLKRDRLFSQAKVGLQVVNLDTGAVVFASGEELNLNPASTMKVVTSATALKLLGPSYRFTTDLYTTGDLDAAGTLHGNLYVEGHGDPSMVVERLWKMVGDLKLHGVERIEGSVIFDDDFHVGGTQLEGWNKPADIERGPSYFATLSALSLNFNTVDIVVGPGTAVGKPGRVQLETPAAGAVEVVNEVTTVAASGRRGLIIEREGLEGGKTRFVAKGTVPLGGEYERYYRTVTDPTAQFMGVFQEQLRQQGVVVTGRLRRGDTPPNADRILQVRSASLAAILMDMNKLSNNFIAEQVLRTLGAEQGAEGSTAAGLAVVDGYLASLGISPEAYTLVNGSGLSRQAMLRPTVLTAVLLDMANDPQVGQEFASTLAIAGYDGTLWARLRDDPGRLRGKTGTIDGVHCLAGYLDDANGQRYAFAFMVNNHGGRVRSVKALHDRFARTMFKVGAPSAD